MADQMNDERSEGNVDLCDGKSSGNSELQQLTSGYGNRQIQEAINPCSLMLEEDLMYHDERQNVPEKISNTNTTCFQLGFPFIDVAETASIHTNSILGSQNIFQQENNFYAQQPCVTPNCKTASETGAQQSVLFEFENYANQILGQKLIQPLVASNNSAAETNKDQMVDAFVFSQTASNSDDQQAAISDDGISKSVENFHQQLQIEKQEKLWTLCDNESSTRNETKMNENELNDNTDKNSENRDSGHQQLEKCEVTSTEQQHSVNENVVPEDFTANTVFIGLQYIDGKLFNVIGGLSNLANDCKQRFHLPIARYQKLQSTGILDEILHLVPESNEQLQETPFNAEFCETDHSEELTAKEIHAELEYSMPGIIPEIENIKVIHHITEEIPLVQNKPERTFLGENCSENEGFVIEQKQTNYINEPTELLISECDPENARQEILREEVERGKEFLPSTVEERSDNMKSVQVMKNFEDISKIQNEHKQSVECEKLQEQLLCERQQKKIANVEIEKNIKNPSKLLGLIPDERETEVSEANTLVYESARVSEEERKSDLTSNISDNKCEIYNQEGNENIAVDNAIIIRKSIESFGSANMREEKNNGSLQNELKNVNKDVTTSLKPTIKTTKKTIPATGTKKVSTMTDAMSPISKDVKKTNRMMTDRKSVTKLAVTLPSVSIARNIKLKEKKNCEAELKHTKNGNAKILKSNITSTVTSKITQKKLHESVNFGKIQLNNNAKVNMKNKPKDIIKDYRKITKEMENNEKALIGKVKKIGIIDLEPLVWTETLMPAYEQIWENCESVNQIIDNKTNIGFEEKIENEIEKELKTDAMVADVESNNMESMWQLKKNSEFVEIEVTKSIILSERNEINAPQCFALSNNNEEEIIEDSSDCLKISEQNENVVIEEEIVVKDSSSEKHEIEISSTVAIKSSEATELSLKMNSKIPLEQKTSDTMMGQKLNLSGIQNEIEADAKDGTGEMIIDGKEEMIPSEKEKLEVKVARNNNGEESSRTGKKELALAGSGSEQQTQPELEINDGRRHHGEKSHSKNYQWKGQFGAMYSDVPEEYMHNTAGKDNSRKQQETGGQQNYSHQVYGKFSDNIELKDNYQQQQSENQNHSRKQQQQQPGDTNSGCNQNYSGQQGHRKRNKRNKKPRNW
ncbi:unnamed protein product [Wuchereria bancrofti]|uniref:Uncharacterized protein n=2 Tax=Wuchereria bancrofti TaxID=6293 RepID=A0A3P7DNK8_WUCBA|nr:unnamed protein product [Wuchereria bancrofti]